MMDEARILLSGFPILRGFREVMKNVSPTTSHFYC